MSAQSGDRRLLFHLKMSGNDGYIPHPDLNGRNSNFIDLPNRDFSDPLMAQEQMRRCLANLEMGELLGFDSIAMMEQRVPAIYPSSTVIAAWLLARTQRIRVGAMGPVSSTYLNPLKIAEEIAMLDVMSGGRVFFAFPLGTGPAYYQMGGNPTTARRRHAEAVQLVLRALTEPGPFEHRGEFFNLPYVNIYPRPLSKPEAWIPASGSRESQVEAARGRHTYMLFLNGREGVKKNTDALRKIANEEFGYDPPPKQIALVLYIYVAETDAQAKKEFEPHLLWFFQNVLKGTFEDYTPPGSTTVPSLAKRLENSSGFHTRPENLTYEDLLRDGLAIAGSPETVTAELERFIDEVGAGQIIVYGDGGTAPEWMVRKSMDLFAREVMPKFRPPGGRPVWADELPAGFQTISEAGARLPKPPLQPLTRMDGELYETYTAHVDELRVPVGEDQLKLHRPRS
ncbi:MAG TPA: LLM class flavin-dependent oxidoreductase [Baekduia sp.]|nr:LLM class flavin-dependent oxidoreductase [Baekduia sp.]